jgi:REP element-mobilizing transposase RayT
MGTRKITFANNEYYHIFNRGVDKRIIFNNKEQLYYFFKSIKLLNCIEAKGQSLTRLNLVKEEGDELVEIVAYCLLPNHFHLLLRQKTDDGIVKFMQKLGTSYTMFFNKMEKRSGALFQGRFKATHISGIYSLPIVASYINLNYKHHNINPKENLVKSSMFEYLSTEQGDSICNKKAINKVIKNIGNLEDYKQFAKNCSIDFAGKRGSILNYNDFEF